MWIPEWKSLRRSLSKRTANISAKAVLGADFSLDALAKENARVDWWANAGQFKMPVFIVSGRFDHNTPSGLQKAWFDRIEAPLKMHIWFEKSSHSPLFEESVAFNQFMIGEVLPVAQKRRAVDR